MSLETDLVSLLTPLAAGGVHAMYVPSKVAPPYIVFRVISREKESLLNGSDPLINSVVAFSCFCTTYDEAVALAVAVSSTIESSGLISYNDNQANLDIDFNTDAYFEVVYFGFWHN